MKTMLRHSQNIAGKETTETHSPGGEVHILSEYGEVRPSPTSTQDAVGPDETTHTHDFNHPSLPLR